jgi:HAD superfamily hydrolase (TIGR01509 family)
MIPVGSPTPSFVFDLDGTLIDSVYQHVLAWKEALERIGLSLAVWRIHRRIGMSGGLLAQALGREIQRPLSSDQIESLQQLHAAEFERYAAGLRPLPGACQLLRRLSEVGVHYAIATSGRLKSAQPSLEALEVGPEIPVITRNEVLRAKPDPDLFLVAAQRLNVPQPEVIVVGDSVWDLLAARRAGSLGVGVLSGGYGEEELYRAGAYRVYQDPADLLAHLDELGVRTPD